MPCSRPICTLPLRSVYRLGLCLSTTLPRSLRFTGGLPGTITWYPARHRLRCALFTVPTVPLCCPTSSSANQTTPQHSSFNFHSTLKEAVCLPQEETPLLKIGTLMQLLSIIVFKVCVRVCVCDATMQYCVLRSPHSTNDADYNYGGWSGRGFLATPCNAVQTLRKFCLCVHVCTCQICFCFMLVANCNRAVSWCNSVPMFET